MEHTIVRNKGCWGIEFPLIYFNSFVSGGMSAETLFSPL